MNCNLVRREDRWDLYNSKGHKIASSKGHPKIGHTLSVRNCEAIENGYDLDELAEKEFPLDYDIPLFETLGITEKSHKCILIGMLQGTLQKGFQKALEILGDKKFSEEDIEKAIEFGHKTYHSWKDRNEEKFIQSLQQTEWEVDIEMEYVGECNGNNDEGCFQDSPGHNCGCFERRLKLDADGCLILKRI